ncbi:type II secretion system protein N [Alcanivorax hongdengensis]|nr:type II secretion system protein N [Alcanivorax hongdengensis]
MPAAVITSQWPTARAPTADALVAPPPPTLYGLWWNGQGRMQWQGQSLDVSWRLDWHGLTPGIQLALQSGQVNARGWLGADWGSWRLEQWQASLPVNLLAPLFPQAQADGKLDIELSTLQLTGREIRAVRGQLQYSGGTVTLPQGMTTAVPAIHGDLTMEQQTPRLQLTGPDQQALAEATLEGKTLNLQVFRALPQLLDMSAAGNASEVVFRSRQPMPVSARSG